MNEMNGDLKGQGVYRSAVITYDKEQRIRRAANISESNRAYWQSFTPEQRKQKCSHLHSPRIKAKARENADHTYRSSEYRMEQSERIRKWHLERWLARWIAAGGAAQMMDDKRTL